MFKNSPPKTLWRGNQGQNTLKKPAKTTLAGKNVHGPHEIPRQNRFDGESRWERKSRAIRLCKKRPAATANTLRLAFYTIH